MICIYKSLRCISLYCLDYNIPCSKDPRPVSLNHNAFVINTNKLAITVQSLASVSLLIHAVYVPLIMFMSGHRSNKSFKTHNRHMLDEHKLSVSSCLSNVTNPNQNNSCKITNLPCSSSTLSLATTRAQSASLSVFPQEEVELHSKEKPPITLHAVVWSAPNVIRNSRQVHLQSLCFQLTGLL